MTNYRSAALILGSLLLSFVSTSARLVAQDVHPELIVVQESSASDNFEIEPGFESLLNGKDLTGWNILPTTADQKKGRAQWLKNDPNAPLWPIYDKTIDFAGKTQSEDGRFVAKDGMLVVTVPPEGRKVQMLFTKREFSDDFTLKLEFRAASNADSGVFIRGKQLQCRDYPTAGPYKNLKHFNEGGWNEMVIVVKGRTAHCSCNGEVLEAKFKVPPSGPIGVEGDRGKLEYRRMRVRLATHADAESNANAHPTKQ